MERRKFPQFLSEKQIAKRIQELAKDIEKDYNGEEIVVIGILNGSFIFCADLVRALSLPLMVDFISVSSYSSTASTGKINLRMDVKHKLEGKNILLVEDIVDTGLTMTFLIEHFQNKKVKSLRLCSLLLKRAHLKADIKVDYLGFDIEDKFVIGYGLDLDGYYRELPYIGVYTHE